MQLEEKSEVHLMKESRKNIINLFVEVHHGSEQLNKLVGGI
jgi:hypothetical protein